MEDDDVDRSIEKADVAEIQGVASRLNKADIKKGGKAAALTCERTELLSSAEKGGCYGEGIKRKQLLSPSASENGRYTMGQKIWQDTGKFRTVVSGKIGNLGSLSTIRTSRERINQLNWVGFQQAQITKAANKLGGLGMVWDSGQAHITMKNKEAHELGKAKLTQENTLGLCQAQKTCNKYGEWAFFNG